MEKVELGDKIQTKVNKKQVTHTRNLKCITDFVVNLDWFA